MKSFVGAAGLIIGASAAAVRRDQCCFQLTASGGAQGSIGQLGDGQNRIGGGFPPATYCINNGGITDKNGRGCILTPPTTQFQCDSGATPTYGFSISQGGEVQYNGSEQFYACPATDNGEYNLYTTPAPGQEKCVKVTLSTGGQCAGGNAPKPSTPASSPKPSAPASKPESKPATSVVKTTVVESKPAPSPSVYTTQVETKPAPAPSVVKTTEYYTTTLQNTVVESAPAEKTTMKTVVESSPPKNTQPAESQKPTGTKPAPSQGACPAALTGPYQTPHLIVPVSSAQPDKAYGTQYNATISPEECTIFNFDIPSSYAGKQCSTVFLFPEQSQLETSAYTFSGSGELVFSELSKVAYQKTTWNTCPSKKSELGSIAIQSGNSYTVSSGSCAAGTTQSIEVCSSNGLSLEFFEDYNPSPLGLYITSC